MKRRAIVSGLVLASVIAMFLSGCGSKDTSPVSETAGIEETTEGIREAGAPTGRIAFHVRYVYPSGKAAKPAVVDAMTAYVYESDGTKIAEANLEKVGGRGKASITVSAGDNRRVDLVAYDESLVSWLGSDQDVDVVAGETTTAEVTMKPFVPILAELVSPDVDASYTVIWSTVGEATSYLVEESEDQGFSSPQSIYSGTDSTTDIEKTADGMYWYRAKATGRYGDGVWCPVHSIEVAILGVPVLQAIASPDTDGTYTVQWSAASHAEQYVVEEDDNEAFSSPTEVYAGTALSVERTDMADGTYWYRAKATNPYGESAWSDAVSVKVPPPDGTIDIDVPWPSNGDTTVSLPGGATMEMVWIEPGTFTMGSPSSEPGRGDDESPQHEVTISRGFYLGKYEITQGQWESVMGTRPWEGKSQVQENPNHPAVWISWNDMQAFIAALNAAEDPDVYRLPTEAEWEYACRAGTTTRWSFGEDESQVRNYAWCQENAWDVGEGYAHAVGTKLWNPWGLYDMYGNVYEWCQDWYGAYPSGPQTDPTGPVSGSRRVLRGGAYHTYARTMRSAFRNIHLPGDRESGFGARLVRQGQ